MSVNANNQALILLCHQIANEGQNPSIALLRSKAPFKVSVTEAIEAMKYYKATQQAIEKSKPIATSKTNEPDLEKRVTFLEKKVEELEKIIAKLSL